MVSRGGERDELADKGDGAPPRSLRSRTADLLGVRRAEVLPVVLMTAYGFLALTSYYVLKPVRNSVFLDRVGADALPVLYILVALIVTGAAALYSRFVDRWSPASLIQGTFAFLGLGLLAFRGLLVIDSVAVSAAFFVWGKLYPLFLVSQFWLTGNLVFEQAQARRLFGIIGLGLIVGGIAGGGFAGFAATTLGSENLVVAAGLPLIGCSVLVRVLFARHAPSPDAPAPGGTRRLLENVPKGTVQAFRSSEHLRNIAALLLVTTLVSTIVDWQFNRAIELFVLGEDEKTAFFGRFFATVNIASVLFQLVLTGLVLRRFGVGIAVFVLPFAIALGTTALFVLPVLVGATLLKGLEGTVRYSLDQSSREYLFLPVPYEQKVRAKPLIDLAVYRGGTGLGGLLLLVLVNLLGLGVRQIALVAGGLVVLWGYLAMRARASFRYSIRNLIGARDVDIGDLVTSRVRGRTIRERGELVRGGVEESSFEALPLLDRVLPSELTGATDLRDRGLLRSALETPNAEVREAAARLTGLVDTDAEPRDVVRLLADEAHRDDAARVIARADGEDNARLAPLVADADLPAASRIRLPALLYENATGDTVRRLVDVMPDLPAVLRYRCLKTLGRLRRNREKLLEEVDTAALARLELDDANHWTLECAEAAGATGLLARVLEERRWQSLERLFRALGLEYGVTDLHAAFRGLRHGATEYGLELLEIAVGHRWCRKLAPLLEAAPPDERHLRKLRSRVDGSPRRHPGDSVGLDVPPADPMVVVLADYEAGRLPDTDRIRALGEHLELRRFTSSLPTSLTDPRGIVEDLERAERLSETDLFGELTTEDLVVLGALSDARSVETGETVVAEGQLPGAVLVVLEGRIEARRDDDMLFAVERGETIGQLGLLDGRPSAYDLIAARDSDLLAVAYEDLLDLMEERFSVVQAMLRYLGRIVRGEGGAEHPERGSQ